MPHVSVLPISELEIHSGPLCPCCPTLSVSCSECCNEPSKSTSCWNCDSDGSGLKTISLSSYLADPSLHDPELSALLIVHKKMNFST